MRKIFEFITELIGWFQIILSPLLIGLVIGAIIYFNKQDSVGLVIGITIAAIGLTTGIILATRVWRKRGTINFISRIDTSPELDNLEEQNKDK